jgi:hypothetical protein
VIVGTNEKQILKKINHHHQTQLQRRLLKTEYVPRGARVAVEIGKTCIRIGHDLSKASIGKATPQFGINAPQTRCLDATIFSTTKKQTGPFDIFQTKNTTNISNTIIEKEKERERGDK